MSQKPHDRTMAIERAAEIGRNFRLRRGPMLIGRGFGVGRNRVCVDTED